MPAAPWLQFKRPWACNGKARWVLLWLFFSQSHLKADIIFVDPEYRFFIVNQEILSPGQNQQDYQVCLYHEERQQFCGRILRSQKGRSFVSIPEEHRGRELSNLQYKLEPIPDDEPPASSAGETKIERDKPEIPTTAPIQIQAPRALDPAPPNSQAERSSAAHGSTTSPTETAKTSEPKPPSPVKIEILPQTQVANYTHFIKRIDEDADHPARQLREASRTESPDRLYRQLLRQRLLQRRFKASVVAP